MALGPGKYDELCTYVREMAKAEGVALIVIHGGYGSGFSVQAPLGLTATLPVMLRLMADQIEHDGGAMQ